jgi:hypothetical protein
MPPVSQKQRAAMHAAASGKSTLGIPKKVGAEFVAADKPGKLPQYKNKNEEKGERKKDSERPHYAPLKNLGKGGY